MPSVAVGGALLLRWGPLTAGGAGPLNWKLISGTDDIPGRARTCREAGRALVGSNYKLATWKRRREGDGKGPART